MNRREGEAEHSRPGGGDRPSRPAGAWREVLCSRSDADIEVDAELEAHLEGTVDLLMERGLDESAARREAHRRFGDAQRHRRILIRLARRRSLREAVRMIGAQARSLGEEAWRNVRHSPGMSVAVVMTMLLGIGVNGAIFGTVDQLLLSRPPHVVEPGRVVRVMGRVRFGESEPRVFDMLSYSDVVAMRQAGTGAQVSGAAYRLPETLGEGASAIRVRVARVDEAYFPLVGVPVVLGRPFGLEDHRPDATPVALISHDLWIRRFGGDVDVLGRSLRVASGRYVVVGILPAGFHGAQSPATEVWTPLEVEAESLWGVGWDDDPNVVAFGVLARLPTGTNPDLWATRAQAAVLGASRGAARLSEMLGLEIASLVPGDGPRHQSTVGVARLLGALSLLVLVVACANAANLFLADAERRQRATILQLALGATPTRLRAEILVRTAVLASVGAAGAGLVSVYGGDWLQDFFLGGLSLPGARGPGRMIGFVAALALAATVLTGIAPAWARLPSNLREALGSAARVTSTRSRLRGVLVALQLALSTILLLGAGLFVTSLRNALDVDLGFNPNGLLVVRPEPDEDAGVTRSSLNTAALDAVRADPDVVSASATVAVPYMLLNGLSGSAFPPEGEGRISVNAVGSDFFRTMNLPILRGRALDESDLVEGAEPVAVVGLGASRALWADADPLGRCLQVGPGEPLCTRVIGISTEHAGVRWEPGELVDPTVLQAWIPLGHPASGPPTSLLVRLGDDGAKAMERVRQSATVQGARYVSAERLALGVERETRPWRLGASLFALYAGVALLLAVLGLYAVLSWDVAQRRREFGIRRALGGQGLRVLAPVATTALPMVLAGVLVGTAIALIGAPRITPLLFKTSAADPRVLLGTALVLLGATTAALVRPAWRVLAADPRDALTEE